MGSFVHRPVFGVLPIEIGRRESFSPWLRSPVTGEGIDVSRSAVDVLTPLDVELEFRIPRSSQKKARAVGSFAPFFRVGRRVYYTRDSLLSWIAAQEQHQAGGLCG